MDDVGFVGEMKPLGNRDQDLDLALERDLFAALDDLVQVLAGQELLDDVRRVVLDAEVVDRRDVAVVEVARELRFPEEAALDLGVVQLAGLGQRPSA
jgi:hypothetical protein